MVAVVGKTGKPLDPTTEARARRLLKKGRAVIFRYRPIFTIRLTEREDGITHATEFKTDTGSVHVGISICNDFHEIVNEQRDLHEQEVERNRERAMYRRNRRSRKWHRKPGFSKDTKADGWFAPSIRHKIETIAEIGKKYGEVLPITKYILETGKFDTQALKAAESEKPIPEGTDYQQGERYLFKTLRAAVFTRDGYTCQCCGRGVKDGAVLHMHHIGFWKKDRSNRLPNLLTVCEKCHNSKNHNPGGALYGMPPSAKSLKDAAFMNTVRFEIVSILKKAEGEDKVFVTNGAKTSIVREQLHIKKTHSNDAYCMGELHPAHRAHFRKYRKMRRNNRNLEKFRDAVYVDTRDGSTKKGAEIGCNRTKRNIPRNNDRNERTYRGEKIRCGIRIIRKKKYSIRPGDIVSYRGKRYVVKGIKNNGRAVALNGCNPSVNSIKVIRHVGGWAYA